MPAAASSFYVDFVFGKPMPLVSRAFLGASSGSPRHARIEH
jgi:hypothetical protein